MRKKDLLNKYILNQSIYIKLVIVAISFILIIILMNANANDEYIMVYKLNFNNYILFILNALCGAIFILTLSSILPASRIFNFYGRNTIIILGFHLLVYAFIKAIHVFILKLPLDILDNNIEYNLCYLILAMILFIPVITFINRYTPFLIGRKKGILQ
ncbi:hypothetical protein [Dysgonomonas sp. 520]|uniref:hypothetical protein n=1 Tax=Dysgonomonas sp. 520 TaxID=2302931 RepID=UPI0013D035D7|nr:hypothetical protein [Dysgonomonas sp. 520]NDW08974.1 hypothetical protein [Dysgonomonas sp. 520]